MPTSRGATVRTALAALTLVCASVAFAATVSAQSQSTPAQSPAPTTTTSTPPSPKASTPATTTGLQPLTAVGTPATTGTATAPAPRETKAAANESKAAAKAVDPRTTELSAAYQIGPEDLLDISVWKNVELSRVVPVRPDGKVSLPLVNDIQAAGLTPTELRDRITTKLAEYIPAPEVSVMVREVHSRKVAVVGAVKMPGRYEMKSPMTVLEALALAQGLSDFASRDRIVVLREVNGKTTEIPFNYRKIGDNGSQQNFFLRPGDIVVVP
jgi:polysaccharide export outer membrane protein